MRWTVETFDGVNAEIYEYTKEGALVGQFDVLSYGVEDPEGVEFLLRSRIST